MSSKLESMLYTCGVILVSSFIIIGLIKVLIAAVNRGAI